MPLWIVELNFKIEASTFTARDVTAVLLAFALVFRCDMNFWCGPLWKWCKHAQIWHRRILYSVSMRASAKAVKCDVLERGLHISSTDKFMDEELFCFMCLCCSFSVLKTAIHFVPSFCCFFTLYTMHNENALHSELIHQNLPNKHLLCDCSYLYS